MKNIKPYDFRIAVYVRRFYAEAVNDHGFTVILQFYGKDNSNGRIQAFKSMSNMMFPAQQ